MRRSRNFRAPLIGSALLALAFAVLIWIFAS